MSKYSKYQKDVHVTHEMNPLWRGVGCLLIVLVPLLAYGLMLLVMPPVLATHLVPAELQGFVRFPDWVLKVRVLSSVALFIGSIKNLWLGLLLFLLVLLILAGIISLLYTAVYQAVGPARYTEKDAPPTKYKGKKYTR